MRASPEALGHFIHIFAFTSPNQHKLKKVNPVQKNKPCGQNGGQPRRWVEVRKCHPSLWVGACPGVDDEWQWMFSEPRLSDKELSSISDHLSLWVMQFFSMLFCPAVLARLCSVDNFDCWSFLSSFSQAQQSSLLTDPRSRFLWYEWVLRFLQIQSFIQSPRTFNPYDY